MPPKRMTANPAKAPRHRAGKAVEADVSSSDSEASDDDQVIAPKPIPKPSAPASSITAAPNVSSGYNGAKVVASQPQNRPQQSAAMRTQHQSSHTIDEEGFVTEEESEDGSSDGSEEESEEEESSDDEQPKRLLMRPTFIKKDKRKAPGFSAANQIETKQAEEEARKKKEADELVEEQIRRDLAAKAAGKKHWDDDEDDEDDVDDTDDIDPEAEYAAWKLRELRRIKRDREAIEAREKELEEVERRKNLTEEERRAEDEAFIEKQKEEREEKGKMSYLQKYYHKGAFFQDTDEARALGRRDIMGSRYADDVQNRELLPQALQMRDMTKLGKKGATKYRDLKSEDTGRFGTYDDRRRGPGGARPPTEDERFMSDRDRERSETGQGATGANTMPVTDRRRATGDHGAPYRGNYDDRRDNYRERRPRTRSRSPQSNESHRERSGNGRYSRKRSTSRDADRHDTDKRRRVEQNNL